MLLLPVHLAAWVLRILAVLPLWLLGLPICYVLARREAWSVQPSRLFRDAHGPKRLPQWNPRWAFPWSNDEDGITGNAMWTSDHMHWPQWKRAFVWSAWRNPVNNLRLIWPFGIRIVPERVRTRSNCLNSPDEDWRGDRVLWAYTWQGAFAGLWIRWPYRGGHGQLRIGWKLIPRDARMAPPETDHRSVACGFGLQLQLRG